MFLQNFHRMKINHYRIQIALIHLYFYFVYCIRLHYSIMEIIADQNVFLQLLRMWNMVRLNQAGNLYDLH